MPGIYIHIPFCRQQCHYCNFHFSVSIKKKDNFLNCLLKEIEIQKDFLSDFTKKTSENKLLIDTLYFGGGTPSILNISEFALIINKLSKYYNLKPHAEVTLEANPDDLSLEYLTALKQTPVNRLSIGIQSFQESDLKYLNRIHSHEQAVKSIENAYKAKFTNISADLIYGIPGLTHIKWQKNLQKLINLEVPHISAYCLTVEPKTALDVFIKRGKLEAAEDNHCSEQFEIMLDILMQNGYEHYEISNFGKPGYFSKHNLSYWQNIPYLGMGPSAHSYNGTSRQWNIPNTNKYIETLKKGNIAFEKESISKETAYNEYIMTSLRTQWGCSKDLIREKFGSILLNHFEKEISSHLKKEMVIEENDRIVLSKSGKLFSDKIASDLFKI